MSTKRTTWRQPLIMTHARGTRSSDALSTIRIAAALGAIAVSLTACASAPHGTPARPAPACVIGAAQPGAGDTLILATTAPVDWAHAPIPTNTAERLAFAQVYETLIDVDCEGRARSGLAASWTLDPTKTRVTLALRKDAAFSSGRPLTAGDVLAAWRATPGGLAREIAAGTTIVDDHTLTVSLPDSGWMALASPTLAVYAPPSTARWPEGSGPYLIAESSASGDFVLMPVASASAPYLVSRRVRSGDPRDAIDAGGDVLVTDDPAAVTYAGARANLVAVPLPWSRTYALAVPGAAPKIDPRVIQDAVHVDARTAASPYWWDARPACGTSLDSIPVRADRSNRVVYRRDDRIAKGLAERLVALDSRSVASGLAPNDFARALREGGELSYVLDLPRVSLSPCHDAGELRSSAPWLMNGVDTKLVPLIDTRESAIIDRNRVSAAVDWSGTLRFSLGARP